jgi:hypothetical protein
MLCVRTLSFTLFFLLFAALFPLATRYSENSSPQAGQFYLGFDRNDYPGDDAMKLLRHDFAFTGYWLGPPPGEKSNSWQGKREYLRSLGYGFLLLYRARESRELRGFNDDQANTIGKEDARAAAEEAQHEGFPHDALIILDIEEGGRLSATYHAYLQSWLSSLVGFHFRGGFYCSGIPVKENARTVITTAQDISIHLRAKSLPFSVWVYNDACPPSPGCAFPQSPPPPAASGIGFAEIWQFAQSPRRKEFTAHCPAKYAPDGNCYAPGDAAHKWFLDVNAAASADPSGVAK